MLTICSKWSSWCSREVWWCRSTIVRVLLIGIWWMRQVLVEIFLVRIILPGIVWIVLEGVSNALSSSYERNPTHRILSVPHEAISCWWRSRCSRRYTGFFKGNSYTIPPSTADSFIHLIVRSTIAKGKTSSSYQDLLYRVFIPLLLSARSHPANNFSTSNVLGILSVCRTSGFLLLFCGRSRQYRRLWRQRKLAAIDYGRDRAVLAIDAFFAKGGVLLWLDSTIRMQPGNID